MLQVRWLLQKWKILYSNFSQQNTLLCSQVMFKFLERPSAVGDVKL